MCGAESVEMLHTAHRLTQKLLSRELADGRFRLLLTCIRDNVGDGQHEVNAFSEKARLRSSAGRGATACGTPGRTAAATPRSRDLYSTD